MAPYDQDGGAMKTLLFFALILVTGNFLSEWLALVSEPNYMEAFQSSFAQFFALSVFHVFFGERYVAEYRLRAADAA